MKKLMLTSIAFAALMAGPAMAADRAAPVYRRPVAVAAPVYSWTGFYVGGNVGYSWGDARTDIAGSGTTIAFPGAFVPTFPGIPTSTGFADSNTARLNGVIGGGQVGYNYQFSPKWVLGFEGDIQASGERGSSTFVDPFSTQICAIITNTFPQPSCFQTGPLNGTAVTAYEAKIDWFGTVRGRLGVLITDQVLLYGTGGLAYGQVKLAGNSTAAGTITVTGQPNPVRPMTPGNTAFSASKTNVGFSVGGGIEGKVSRNWTWKLEYLYVDLGSMDAVTTFPGVQPPDSTPITGVLTTHTHFTDNIVRVGLNYTFGNYYAPVVTK